MLAYRDKSNERVVFILAVAGEFGFFYLGRSGRPKEVKGLGRAATVEVARSMLSAWASGRRAVPVEIADTIVRRLER